VQAGRPAFLLAVPSLCHARQIVLTNPLGPIRYAVRQFRLSPVFTAAVASLAGLFGAVSLLLAAIGLYGNVINLVQLVDTLRIKVLRDSVQNMTTDQVHRTSRIVLIVLSLTALLTVLFGYTQAPLPDEGTGAHIFQLAVVAGALTTFLFLGTADWTQPSRAVRQLAVPAAAFVLAFAALYYLENHYYPAHYP
jgi:hypothetical protein